MTEAQLLETLIRLVIFDHAVIVLILTIKFILWVSPKWYSRND